MINSLNVNEHPNEIVQECADRLADAYTSGPITPVRHGFDTTAVNDVAMIEKAYAIQSVNTDRWMRNGRVVVGAKTGLTSRTVQQQLGVDQPDFGVLFADMAVEDGATIEPGRLLQPKVEAEVAFVMRRTPNVERLTTAELLSSIDYVLPALEIVDSRIEAGISALSTPLQTMLHPACLFSVLSPLLSAMWISGCAVWCLKKMANR
ncbi:2-keto-4-pentenoate hydratase [Kineobactrum salinum]|uniref:2-keto-4-pentenoate hydratase n=1 Tax=Kineobactrum salinum TaxID=2708301 RepID=UPI001E4E3E6D|nr:hypothetical protein [Kineobactrum salinum]